MALFNPEGCPMVIRVKNTFLDVRDFDRDPQSRAVCRCSSEPSMTYLDAQSRLACRSTSKPCFTSAEDSPSVVDPVCALPPAHVVEKRMGKPAGAGAVSDLCKMPIADTSNFKAKRRATRPGKRRRDYIKALVSGMASMVDYNEIEATLFNLGGWRSKQSEDYLAKVLIAVNNKH